MTTETRRGTEGHGETNAKCLPQMDTDEMREKRIALVSPPASSVSAFEFICVHLCPSVCICGPNFLNSHFVFSVFLGALRVSVVRIFLTLHHL